jgi:ADP-L-glycero-D-manno-heptose 6-epimerase
MRILVIGGAGFLGSELVLTLAKNKKNLIQVMDTFTHGFPKNSVLRKNILQPFVASIINSADVARVIESFKPDVLYHFAAYNSRPETFGNFRTCAEINYVGTASVTHAVLSVSNRPRKIIFASSLAAAEPQSHYGISKRAAEDLLLTTFGRFTELNVHVPILRFAEIYGTSTVHSSNSMVNFLVDSILSGTNVAVYSPNEQIDCLHISDAVNASILALEKDFTALVDIGSGKGIAIKDIISKIRKLEDYSGQIKFLESSKVPIRTMIADTKAAQDLLGFTAKSDFDQELTSLIRKRKKVR